MTRAAALAAVVAAAGCVAAGDVLSSGDGEGEGSPDAGDPGGDPIDPACAAPLECPLGAVCGRLHDVETSRPLTAADGPLPRVLVAAAPLVGGLPELADARAPDACGRYRADDLGLGAADGVVVIAVPAVDDASWRVTVTRGGIGGVDGIEGARADGFALAAATEARWAAALEVGSVVGDGALLLLYVDMLGPPAAPLAGAPVAGVEVTADGFPAGAGVAYFEDPVVSRRATPSRTRTRTTVPGAALITSIDALAYGGAAPTCGFGASVALEIPGALQVDALVGACAP